MIYDYYKKIQKIHMKITIISYVYAIIISIIIIIIELLGLLLWIII